MKVFLGAVLAVVMFLAGYSASHLSGSAKPKPCGALPPPVATTEKLHPVLHADRQPGGHFNISAHCPAPYNPVVTDPEVIRQYKSDGGDPIATINMLSSAVCQ
jgi:hypothetical protein